MNTGNRRIHIDTENVSHAFTSLALSKYKPNLNGGGNNK